MLGLSGTLSCICAFSTWKLGCPKMIFPFVKRANTQIQIYKYSISQSARKTQHVVYFWKGDCSRMSSEFRTVVQGLVCHGQWPTVFFAGHIYLKISCGFIASYSYIRSHPSHWSHWPMMWMRGGEKSGSPYEGNMWTLTNGNTSVEGHNRREADTTLYVRVVNMLLHLRKQYL